MHIPHFHILRFLQNRELRSIYLTLALRDLALSMIGIFVPIYFIKVLNYSINKTLIFYLIYSVIFGITSPITAKISSKIGFKKSILLSIPFYIVFYYLLNLLQKTTINLAIPAIIIGLADSIFWISLHTDFAVASDKKSRGKEVGFMFSSTIFVSLIGPFIGGLILTFYNFYILFWVVNILLLICVIPLFFSKEIHEKDRFSYKYIFEKAHFKDLLNFIAYGARLVAEGVLWPIFIFLIIKAYLGVGFLFTLASVVAMFSAYNFGKITDTKSKNKLLRYGAVFYSITWFIRSIFKTIFFVSLITLISAILTIMVDIPFTTKTYEKGLKKTLVEYLVFREIALCMGRALIIILVILVNSLTGGFIFTGITTLFHLFF